MRWLDAMPVSVPQALRDFVGGHPLIVERLVRAGIVTVSSAQAFLDPSAYTPTPAFELPDLEIAAARLETAISKGERLLIWGDFDVDGQAATALLYTGLRRLGAKVHYHVPRRQGEGHGLYLPKLRSWIQRGVDVIITCDTGTTAHEAVSIAQAAGVDVVITDHHMLGDSLPPALAVINPMRLAEGHALRDLPGSAVAWELMTALSPGGAGDLLDLVALGIVADDAKLAGETRYLLQRGLDLLRVTSRVGLQALFARAEISPLEITETDISFALVPRLNAQGRLGDALASVELLTTTDEARAAELANQLEGMNARRRLESRLIEDGTQSMIERDPSLLDYAAIVLSHAEWTGGVVGIVANRLARTYHKPVVMLCESDDVAFGSARSVPGCNITDALHANRDLLLKFGGHAMAAGLSLRTRDIYEFRRCLSRTVRQIAPATTEEPVLEIEGYLGLNEISLDLATDLARLSPFGHGNPSLTLATNDLRLARKKKLGRRGDHYQLTVENSEGAQGRVQWWNIGEARLPEAEFDLAYSLRINRFKGAIEAVMELVHLKPHESDEVILVSSAPSIEIANFADHPEPHAKLAEVLARYPDAIVWCEGDPSVEGCNRTQLRMTDTLVIWTAPAGPEELRVAIKLVKPQRVIVFNQQAEGASIDSFLRRLGGLLKHVIKTGGGETTLDALAAAAAQRSDAVRYGLKWYADTGKLSIEQTEDGRVAIAATGSGIVAEGRPQLEKLLRNVLEETEAFRKHGAHSYEDRDSPPRVR